MGSIVSSEVSEPRSVSGPSRRSNQLTFTIPQMFAKPRDLLSSGTTRLCLGPPKITLQGQKLMCTLRQRVKSQGHEASQYGGEAKSIARSAWLVGSRSHPRCGPSHPACSPPHLKGQITWEYVCDHNHRMISSCWSPLKISPRGHHTYIKDRARRSTLHHHILFERFTEISTVKSDLKEGYFIDYLCNNLYISAVS